MTVIPIAQYLAQLNAGQAPESGELGRSETPILRSLDPKDAEEWARKIEEAFARGREEGLQAGEEAARASFAAELEAERAKRDVEVAATRQAWADEEGARLAALLASAVAQLNSEIADSVASILAPFVDASVREKALAALVETVAGVLAEEPAVVRVSGPSDLIEALRQRLGSTEIAIDYAATKDVEVSVVADHTVIETRLKALSDHLDGKQG